MDVSRAGAQGLLRPHGHRPVGGGRVIGLVELLGLLATELGVATGPLAWFAMIDLGDVGDVLVAVFVATRLIALAVWRFGRIDQHWTADAVERQPASSG